MIRSDFKYHPLAEPPPLYFIGPCNKPAWQRKWNRSKSDVGADRSGLGYFMQLWPPKLCVDIFHLYV